MMVKRKKVIPAKARHPTEGNENNKKGYVTTNS